MRCDRWEFHFLELLLYHDQELVLALKTDCSARHRPVAILLATYGEQLGRSAARTAGALDKYISQFVIGLVGGCSLHNSEDTRHKPWHLLLGFALMMRTRPSLSSSISVSLSASISRSVLLACSSTVQRSDSKPPVWAEMFCPLAHLLIYGRLGHLGQLALYAMEPDGPHGPHGHICCLRGVWPTGSWQPPFPGDNAVFVVGFADGQHL